MADQVPTVDVEEYIDMLKTRLANIGMPYGHKSTARLEEALHHALRQLGRIEERNQILKQLADLWETRLSRNDNEPQLLTFPTINLTPPAPPLDPIHTDRLARRDAKDAALAAETDNPKETRP